MFGRRQAELASPVFRGIWAAAVTPHKREHHAADFAGMLEVVDQLSRSGVDGIVLLGATGEFLHLKPDDRQRLVHLAVKRSRVPIIAGVSHSTLEISVQLAEAAVDSGCAGLLLMPPYFYRYSPDEILEFYRLFALAVGGALPILLYNLPVFTSAITWEVARELLENGDAAGIKDSSGDKSFMDHLLALRKDREFSLVCGNDRLLRYARSEGADAAISGVAGCVPELVLALDAAIQSRDFETTARLESMLAEFVAWIERFPVPVGLSAAAEARGAKVGPPAVPLTADEYETLEEFKAWFTAWLPEVQKLTHARSSR